MAGMRTSGCLAVAVCLCASSIFAQAPSSDPFQPVATMKQLMLEIVHPASNEIQLAISRAPITDREWAALKRSAMTLAESGNLLIMRNRSSDWVAEARTLIETGSAAYKAADARDGKTLAAIGARIDATCTNCHKKFRPALFAPAR
jgi:hypothetical protein